MTKQELARTRNWFKFRLASYVFPVETKYTTKEEDDILIAIHNLRLRLLDNFDNTSRLLGLHVPEHRCTYCGREAKYHIGGLKTGGFTGEKVCYKHWKEYSSDEEPLLILTE